MSVTLGIFSRLRVEPGKSFSLSMVRDLLDNVVGDTQRVLDELEENNIILVNRSEGKIDILRAPCKALDSLASPSTKN